jgi:hypothetical protein
MPRSRRSPRSSGGGLVESVGGGRVGSVGRGAAGARGAVASRVSRGVCGGPCAAGLRSAASHWGLLASQAAFIDVTATRSRTGASGVRLHRSRSLDARDTTTHEGIPITKVPRTLLDLAATVRLHRLERALAQAQRLQLYDHRAITDLLARSNGHRGTGALTEAASRDDPKWTRSELEAWFLEVLRDAGLPEPLVNFSLTAPDHPRLEVDFYWPTHHLIVELDGWDTHRTRAAFETGPPTRRRPYRRRMARPPLHLARTRETIQRRLRALLPG